MVFRTWICIVAMVSWSALGVSCAEAAPDTQIETVAQELTAAGPLSAIQLCGLIKGGACPDGTYCRHHDGACEDTSIGWCAPVSEMCTMQYDPVCGCDGQTYGNECSMMGAAVSMAHDGICEAGCNWDAECLDGQTCDVQGCGEDASGSCVKASIACNRMWAPVCGCDGETYSNDCHRINAGVGLDHKGVCASPCGGIAGFQCEGKDDVCYYPDGTCDIVDNMGVCEEPPKICPKTTDPVCGCDGTSYRNACMMKRQGVSMDHPGLCCTPILCLVGEPVDTDDDGCADFCPPAQGCEGPNPAGCKNTGCDDGETCVFGIDCTASICFCDSVVGAWNCTKDCGGGTCVPDDAPCCDPADEPGSPGNAACFEGASCCSDGQWHCNDPSTASVCEAPGLVCEASNPCEGYEPPGCEQSGCADGYVCGPSEGCVPSSCSCNPETGVVMCTMDCGGGTCVPEEPSTGCCDPTLEPGTGNIPTCFEGSTCCADGAWQCNGAMGQPVCEAVGSVCEGSCCDPTKEPGVGDNDFCFEGSSCCSDGTWQCNDGGAGSVCEAPGWVCQNLCTEFTPPGCVQSGCDAGYVCDTTVGCVSSSCSCDPSDGSILCTDDCGGGTCVPEDSNAACEEPNPQACKAGDCAAGTTCDFSFGCAPSNCNCWADADGVGHWNCTKDCQPGVCVPDDLGAGCCIDDAHCEVGQLCVNGGPNSVGVCKQLPPPAWPATSCWSDQGCPDGETCDGGSVCPCEAQCIVADSWGLCSGGDGGQGEPDQPENPE